MLQFPNNPLISYIFFIISGQKKDHDQHEFQRESIHVTALSWFIYLCMHVHRYVYMLMYLKYAHYTSVLPTLKCLALNRDLCHVITGCLHRRVLGDHFCFMFKKAKERLKHPSAASMTPCQEQNSTTVVVRSPLSVKQWWAPCSHHDKLAASFCWAMSEDGGLGVSNAKGHFGLVHT